MGLMRRHEQSRNRAKRNSKCCKDGGVVATISTTPLAFGDEYIQQFARERSSMAKVVVIIRNGVAESVEDLPTDMRGEIRNYDIADMEGLARGADESHRGRGKCSLVQIQGHGWIVGFRSFGQKAC